MNLAAIDELVTEFPSLDVVFIESGGDNLAATFSPELADLTLYVIDVAQGEEIPRKGGPGITRSDMLVINKVDLAPYVDVDIDVMRRDATLQRENRPFVFTRLKPAQVCGEGAAPAAENYGSYDADGGLQRIVDFIVHEGMLKPVATSV